ncbi:hemerythrin family protein [Bowmanella sp. Y26]|uniref:bacteriohemerythrin n=1 Tax=Bowmanella yangjiangensis TaxID=2811230 RepID=UPI001BDBE34F|nr:hemerythrin family protein [Bowmanella yangjiangensis]MBT1063413.1 hemerythrin family protein [Bowmanella yangjiangensis]
MMEDRAHLVLWCEVNMPIGIPEIDYQHRQLLDTINLLHAAIRQNWPNPSVLPLATNLLEQTQRHFLTETPYLQKLCDQQQRLHQLNHKHFLQAMQAFIDRLGSDIHMSALSVNEQLASLAEWYSSHILNSDRELQLA